MQPGVGYNIYAASLLGGFFWNAMQGAIIVAIAGLLIFIFYYAYKRNRQVRKFGHRWEPLIVVEETPGGSVDISIDEETIFWAKPGKVADKVEWIESMLEKSNNQREVKIHVFRFGAGIHYGETEEEYADRVFKEGRQIMRSAHEKQRSSGEKFYYQETRKDRITSKEVEEH